MGETGLPPDTTVVQLFYDSQSDEWRHLFVPTVKVFGHFIDRMIDIETGKQIAIDSADEFIKLADISSEREGSVSPPLLLSLHKCGQFICYRIGQFYLLTTA